MGVHDISWYPYRISYIDWCLCKMEHTTRYLARMIVFWFFGKSIIERPAAKHWWWWWFHLVVLKLPKLNTSLLNLLSLFASKGYHFHLFPSISFQRRTTKSTYLQNHTQTFTTCSAKVSVFWRNWVVKTLTPAFQVGEGTYGHVYEAETHLPGPGGQVVMGPFLAGLVGLGFYRCVVFTKLYENEVLGLPG